MEATIMAIMINEINNQDTVNMSSFMETFSLKQGMKKFIQKVYESIYGQMLQLHQGTFLNQLNYQVWIQERKKIIIIANFLVKKGRNN